MKGLFNGLPAKSYLKKVIMFCTIIFKEGNQLGMVKAEVNLRHFKLLCTNCDFLKEKELHLF